MAAGTEDQDCGSGHAKTQGRDACPMLGLVTTASGEFCQHQAPRCQGNQGEPRDHRLAGASKDKNVENDPEHQTSGDGREDDQTNVTAPRSSTFLGGWVVAPFVRHGGHVDSSYQPRVDLEGQDAAAAVNRRTCTLSREGERSPLSCGLWVAPVT